MTAGRRVRVRSDDVMWQDVDGEVVLLDLRTSQYLQVNSTGSLLFEHMREGADRESLVTALAAEYDVPEALARQDVEAFLLHLEQHDLLVDDPGDAAS